MKFLTLKWTISRARDTDGYNVVTLRDGDKKYKAMGGGYDMVGTVFGDWLMANHYDEVKKLPPYTNETNVFDGKPKYYGLFERDGKFWLDGGCGLDSMITIAKAIGLSVKYHCVKGDIKYFVITGGEDE